MPSISRVEWRIGATRGFVEEVGVVDLRYEASLIGFIRTVTFIVVNAQRNTPKIAGGTHTAGTSTTVLTDSAADFFRAFVQPGDIVTNTTDSSAVWEVVTVDSTIALTVQLVTSGGGDDDFDTSDAYTIGKRNLEDIFLPYTTEICVTGREIEKVLLAGVVQEAVPMGAQGRFLKVVAVSHEAEIRDGVPQTDISAVDSRSAVIQDALAQVQNGQRLFPFISNTESAPGIEHSPSLQTAQPDFSKSARGALASFIDIGKGDYWGPIALQEPTIPLVQAAVSDESQELVFPSAQGNLAQSFQITGSTTRLVSKVGCYLGSTGTIPTGNVYARLETNNEDGDAAAVDVPSGELVAPWAESELRNMTDVVAGGGMIDFSFTRPVPLRDNTVYWIVLSYQEDNTSGYTAATSFVKWFDDSAAGYANGAMATYASNVWTAIPGKDFRFRALEYTDAVYYYDASVDGWEDHTTEALSNDATRLNFMDTLVGGTGAIDDRLYFRLAGPIQSLLLDLDNTLASAEYGVITVKYYGDDGAKVTGEHDGSDNASTLSDADKDFRLLGISVGDILHNRADGSFAVITVIGQTTLTAALDGPTGVGADFDKGDQYSVINLEQVTSGTHTGGASATVLTDSGAAFDDGGVHVGDLVVNTSDDIVGQVQSYTATTITVNSGVDMSWATDDTYKVVSRWRTLALKETNVTFTEVNTVKLEWEIPSDIVPTELIANDAAPAPDVIGNAEVSVPSFTDVTDMRGYWYVIQTSVAPATSAEVDVITPGPGSGFVLCVLDETHENVILAAGGLHDTGANNASLVDTSEDFINDHGILAGDIVENLTDGSRGTVTGIATTTNIYDTLAMALAGGTDNDWDVSDAYRILRTSFRFCYFRAGSKPLGGPQTFGLTLRQDSDKTKQIWPLLSGQFSRSTRSSVNRVRVVGRTTGGAVVDQVQNNLRAQREQGRVVMKTIVDYSIKSTAEADDRANTELARLSNDSQRGIVEAFRLPFHIRVLERQNWFIPGSNLLHKLDGSGSAVAVYEHDGGNDSVDLIDGSVNFNKWGVEPGDLLTNVTDGSTAVVTAVSTTTVENDTVEGVLSGGTGDEWDDTDEYKIEQRRYVRVGDLVRVKVNDPDYVDADYIVVAIDYHEPSFVCKLRVSKNLTAPAVGDQMDETEIIQAIQDDARKGVQRASY